MMMMMMKTSPTTKASTQWFSDTKYPLVWRTRRALPCIAQAHKGNGDQSPPERFATKAGAALAAMAILVSPMSITTTGNAMASVPDNSSIGFLCDASNVSDVINEIENAEIPLLQTDVAKLQSDQVGVEDELHVIEQEAAQLAEEYETSSVGLDSLADQTSGVLNQISALKSIMRQNQ